MHCRFGVGAEVEGAKSSDSVQLPGADLSGRRYSVCRQTVVVAFIADFLGLGNAFGVSNGRDSSLFSANFFLNPSFHSWYPKKSSGVTKQAPQTTLWSVE